MLLNANSPVMKKTPVFSAIIVTLSLLVLTVSCSTESDSDQNTSVLSTENPEFNQELATELGADNYGMRRYVLAILKAGPNRDHNEETAMELQRGHMANINRLAEEGKLILAGPFLDDGEMRGIFLFDVETVDEARQLTESDPAVEAGRLTMELHTWYGSAALLKTLEIHRTISRETP